MNERIEELAEQAGWGTGQRYDDCISCSRFDFERFAELIRQDEREACAKLCENLLADINNGAGHWSDGVISCLFALRAKGEK